MSKRFFGYKHWTLEETPRCFYVGRGRKHRPKNSSRNHKWTAVVKRYGLHVEVCTEAMTNDEANIWEIENIDKENTYSVNHSHNDQHDIGCNFTKGGGGITGFKQTHQQIIDRVAKITGQKRTDEQRKRMKGRKKTMEECQKIRVAHLGKEKSAAACANISAGKLGKKVPKIGLALRGRKRPYRTRKSVPKTPEHRAKLKEAALKREAKKRLVKDNS